MIRYIMHIEIWAHHATIDAISMSICIEHIGVCILYICATSFPVGWGVRTCNHWNTMLLAVCLVECTYEMIAINYFMSQLLCLEYVIAPDKCTYYPAHMHIVI